MKITFLSPLFQFPIPWLARYVERFNEIAGLDALDARWEHLLFTDQPEVADACWGRVKAISMDVRTFVDLAEETTGCRPAVTAPGPKFGDLRPAFGLLFVDWLRDADWWGHTDMDLVLGNLDAFWPDAVLRAADLVTDEVNRNAVNGAFALYRNAPAINRLFQASPMWQAIFRDPRYYAFDENQFSDVVNEERRAGALRFCRTSWHEHDGMPAYQPAPRLALDGDGVLRGASGREIPFFHFRRTKPKWPLP